MFKAAATKEKTIVIQKIGKIHVNESMETDVNVVHEEILLLSTKSKPVVK